MRTLGMLCLLLMAAPAMAQPFLTGNQNSILTWEWEPGPAGGVPIKTFVRCSAQRGIYNALEEVVIMPAQEIRFGELFSRPGRLWCILVGWNTVGEGPASAEVPLELSGGLPPKAINFRVKEGPPMVTK